MTLPTKIITRLKNIGNEISTKINNRIEAHNSSENAHDDLLNGTNGYVKKIDKSNHNHGAIDKDGKVTSTTNNVSNVVVTESNGTIKVINKIPQNNVVHQDISGKVDKLQEGHNGKFMKVNSSGIIEPETVTIPELNVKQIKTSGVEIASINGIKFYCNENTTYENATSSKDGLMSQGLFTKLSNIDEGAKNVSFLPNANSGTVVGELTIGGQKHTLYSGNSTAQYGLAQPGTPGLIEYEDVQKIKGVATGATKAEVTGTLSSSGATKIGTIKITNNNDTSSIDLYTPNYIAGNGLSISSRTIGHSNSKIAKRTTASLCKITYDEYGHITAGEAVNTDNLYATKDHTHDTNYAPINHSHDEWVQVEMDPEGRGALYVNKKLKMATFHWTSGATTTYIPSGRTSYNTIPSEYRPRYRISTSINIDTSKPMTLHIKGRGESDKPGQVWVHASTSGQQMISCVLTWVYGI